MSFFLLIWFAKTLVYLHKMRGVRRPVRPVFGSHVHGFFPQLPSIRVLEATEDKDHPLHDPVERDLLVTFGFWLLFGFGLWFQLNILFLFSRLLCWWCCRDKCEFMDVFQCLEEKKKEHLPRNRCRFTFGGARAGRADRARLVFGGCRFALGCTSGTLLWGRRAGTRLPLFAKFKLSFCWRLRQKSTSSLSSRCLAVS